MSDDKDFKEWLQRAGNDSGKKIAGSAAFIGIGTTNFLKDPLCALQLGYAMLLDKPIFMIVDKNMKIPLSLTKIAGCIERVDLDNPKDVQRAQQSIQEFIKQLNP